MVGLSNNDEPDGTFKASDLAKWFHFSPHRDFDLDATTTIFRPDEDSYNEALLMLAIFIGSFGVLLFILLLLFYTCCCACKKYGKPSPDTFYSRKTCYQYFIFAAGLMCSAAIITGFVFNGRVSDGIDDFRNSVDGIQDDIKDTFSLGTSTSKVLEDVHGLIENVINLHGALSAQEETNKMLYSLDYLNKLIPFYTGDKGSDFGSTVHHYDNYRWLVTVSLFTWCLFFCIFCFWVRCQTTICIMIMLTIFSFSSMILTWVVVGADFGIATGTGDFCVHPGTSIKNLTDRLDHPLHSVVIDYYLKCSQAQFNPFAQATDAFQANLNNLTTIINGMHKEYPSNETLNEILHKLQIVRNDFSAYEQGVSCSPVHEEYMEAMDSLCNEALVSLAVVILSFFVIALFSGLLTCCICPLWGYRKSYYQTYPNVGVNIPDGHDGVLWWPRDLDENLGDDRGQNEETPLMQNQQAPNYDGARFRNGPNEAVNINTPVDHNEQGYGKPRHSF